MDVDVKQPTILDATVLTDTAAPTMEPIDRPGRASIEYSLPLWLTQQKANRPLAPFTQQGRELAVHTSGIVRERIMVTAACLLELPLGHFNIKERCGRVYWVAFEPHLANAADPELPVYLGKFGEDVQKALRRYAQQILMYESQFTQDYKRKWWKQARKDCNAVLQALSTDEAIVCMFVEELVYFISKLELPLAFPNGVTTISLEERFLGMSV